MKKITLFIAILLIVATRVTAKINIITSTSDLAYFAKELGGDLVDVKSIASPNADIHFVEVRPSYMAKISKADIVFKVGMDLDKWMDKLIDGSRNSKLKIVDCSKHIKPLEVPTYKVTAKYGDIHPNGNPHYWIGPQNVEFILQSMVEGLVASDPEHAEIYQKNKDIFSASIKKFLDSLQVDINLLKDKEIVYYHDSWPYFNEYTGIKVAGFIEPFPGVTPSPSQITKIIELIKSKNVKVIAMEPYFDKRIPNKIAESTGAKVITLYPSIGGKNKDESYQEWLSGNIKSLVEQIK